MRRTPFVLFLLALGCRPGIGDECETSVDCSATGERRCDVTQPGGYCTQFYCDPGSCPDEAVCILYAATPSAVAACVDPTGAIPYQRSFCLKKCEDNSDCREGYVCADVTQDPAWSAINVDIEKSKVCTVPRSGVDYNEWYTMHAGSADVCSSVPPSQVPLGTGGSGGTGGSAGTGTGGTASDGGEGGSATPDTAGAGGA